LQIGTSTLMGAGVQRGVMRGVGGPARHVDQHAAAGVKRSSPGQPTSVQECDDMFLKDTIA
jgi:hypothetical protein